MRIWDLVELVGLAVIVYGVYWFSPGAALIVAGVLVVGYAVLKDLERE